MLAGMADQVRCSVCARLVPTPASYVVRVDVFADASMPEMTADELAQTDFGAQLTQLIEQMSHLSADDLQNQVARRFEFRICPACQPEVIANPLGLPRTNVVAKN
jgi:hypothetical protein